MEFLQGNEIKSRTQVTLTFAQSIDGYISKPNTQIILSSPEAMYMTHTIRNNSDGILVGVNTLIIDKPSLTTRYVDNPTNPTPIILDTTLKSPRVYTDRSPIIITSDQYDEAKLARKQELDYARIVSVPLLDGKLDLAAALTELYKLGIKKLMVEGGAAVISEFLKYDLYDSLIITICPTLMNGGVKYVNNDQQILLDGKWVMVGKDVVFYYHKNKDKST
ncbi:2,5-diamino-6-(ribosylamino)-4(3H)-pyrimidinone 5'-phosphate reductase [Boothiomyces sp. JEL0866]|nr:2,5-diamino-6-(ribosylamino)-4(3H)-pyrimidinone 5'-phosphate reductase [Boothiomyces sp. JEL0866]